MNLESQSCEPGLINTCGQRLRLKITHPFVSADVETLAGNGFAISDTFHETISHNGVLVLACRMQLERSGAQTVLLTTGISEVKPSFHDRSPLLIKTSNAILEADVAC